MTDHLHGLCKNCLPQCRQILNVGKMEDECAKCNDAEPTIIIEQDSITLAICTKCYLKDANSPKKSEMSRVNQSSLILKNQSKQSKQSMQSVYSASLPPLEPVHLTPLAKADLLSKGFFSSEGKMVRRVQKYFAKFENSEAIFKQLSKKSIINAPIVWQKIISKCDKVGSLIYVFVSKNFIFGCFQHQPIKAGEKGFQDSQSGCFITHRSKFDLSYFKAANQTVVAYNPVTRSAQFGKPACFEIMFGGQIKVKCELIPEYTQWLYQFIVKI